MKEGISEHNIFITGNTVKDSLFIAVDKVKSNPPIIHELLDHVRNADITKFFVLITGHHREKFDEDFEKSCFALRSFAESIEATAFIYSVHLNPNVQEAVRRILSPRDNIYLIEPLPYYRLFQ